MLQEIFQPFFSARPGGIGLGLSVVQRVIKQHQGSISVKSEVGEGSCFTLNLPCRDIYDAEDSRRG